VPPNETPYPRPKLNLSAREKYVAGLIDQLRDLERKTDPKDGAQSAKGKDRAARDALSIADDLVNALAGWALDHQAGLALKDCSFVQFRVKKTPEYPYGLTIRTTDDDHRIETAGRDWRSRDGFPIDPVVARRWLMNLVRANSGIFCLELRLMTLTALEACDYGEIQPMLMATKRGRKVNWTILQLQLKTITFVKYREARGIEKYKALKEIAKAFGVSVNTLRAWEQRLRTEFGPIDVMNRLKIAEEAGIKESNAEHQASSMSMFGQQDLLEFARQ
jgi:DNA-binding transcriptional regulator YiaG